MRGNFHSFSQLTFVASFRSAPPPANLLSNASKSLKSWTKKFYGNWNFTNFSAEKLAQHIPSNKFSFFARCFRLDQIFPLVLPSHLINDRKFAGKMFLFHLFFSHSTNGMRKVLSQLSAKALHKIETFFPLIPEFSICKVYISLVTTEIKYFPAAWSHGRDELFAQHKFY